MLFSSPVFLLVFLPVVVGVHAVLRDEPRNWLLLAASLLFYAWGEPVHIALLLGVALWSHQMSRWVALTSGPSKRWLTTAAVLVDLGVLVAFKYGNLILQTMGYSTDGEPLHLPLGISFYTFQAIAYLIDVYRGEHLPAKSWHRTMLYIGLFPQLVAGPIVRYSQIGPQLERREVDAAGFASGVRRFTVGLAQKVLVADVLAKPVDAIFLLPAGELTAPVVWLGAVLFSIQLYFDFSGYSSMAIGIGRMLGLAIPENFHFPYISRSVRELWRRWHISLTTWFRDYLYVPLGGNRVSSRRLAANLVLVFALCGLWHGAAWTFLIWGLYNGALLSFERTRFGSWLERWPAPLAQAYTLVTWVIGLLIFRSNDVTHSGQLLRAAFGMGAEASATSYPALYLTHAVVLVAGLGALCVVPAARRLYTVASQGRSALAVAALLLFGISAVVSSQAVPFIYFRF